MDVDLLIDRDERFVIGERAQELIVARAPLVDAGENRIDDAEPSTRSDALRRDARSGTNNPLVTSGLRDLVLMCPCLRDLRARVLECTHDRRADSDDSAAARARVCDGPRGRCRYVVGL